MASEAPALPQTFGKYTLVERVAAGGMAEVFRAKIFGVAGFEKTVAIKRILPHFVSDENFVRMFVREANVAVKLSHANVVQVFELGRVGEDYYIALEFVEGRDLKTLIRKAAERAVTLPAGLSAFVAQKICAGLHHAHVATDDAGAPLGIVHRDVSPHNVLLSWSGEVKVADFGIARLQSAARHTRTGTIKGKLAYMSPEQSEGDPGLDARSDVFAVGIVLFEMLTGLRPFEGETDREILKKIREVAAPRVAEYAPCPPELEAIVQKALAKRREDRWQDCASMGRALATFLQKSGTLVDEESVAEAMRALLGPRPVTATPTARSGGTPVLPPGALGGDDDATPPRPSATVPGAGAPSVEVFAAATRPGVPPSAPASSTRVATSVKTVAPGRVAGPAADPTVQHTLERPPQPAPSRGPLYALVGSAIFALAASAFVVGRAQHDRAMVARSAATPTPDRTAPATAIAAASNAPASTPAGTATPARLATTGSVRVDGSPAGAQVRVDGTRVVALGAPVEGLAFGKHSVVVTAEDYRPAAIPVELSAAQPVATPHVALVRGRGEIRVAHGENNEFRVSIPGVTHAGQDLEARFEGVAAGHYTAIILKGDDASHRWTASVTVRDGGITKVRPEEVVAGATKSFGPD